jgi:serine/threonine protein kinase
MDYLQSEGVVHNDLAARNILVMGYRCEDPHNAYALKITDFGLARDSSKEKISNETIVPIRWSSPEVLSGEKSSVASGKSQLRNNNL